MSKSKSRQIRPGDLLHSKEPLLYQKLDLQKSDINLLAEGRWTEETIGICVSVFYTSANITLDALYMVYSFGVGWDYDAMMLTLERPSK